MTITKIENQIGVEYFAWLDKIGTYGQDVDGDIAELISTQSKHNKNIITLFIGLFK